MTWPNSVSTARALPGPAHNFPSGPANDNFRPPFRSWRPPAPAANDNVARTVGRYARFARVLPALNVIFLAWTAYELLSRNIPMGETWGLPGYEKHLDCGGDKSKGVGQHNNNCGNEGLGQSPNTWEPFPVPNQTALRNVGYTVYGRGTGIWGGRRGESWRPIQAPTTATMAQLATLPLTVRSTVPMIVPGSVAPPAEPLRPGKYQAPFPIFPEWSDHGPRSVPRPKLNNLASRRPPRGTKERKIRVRDYAVGRAIEFALSQVTESADTLHAIFEALPMWLKFKYLNAARWREERYNSGRVVAARLRYRALTPQEKVKILYDHWDKVDTRKATENILLMRGSDRMWGKIGQQMGMFQRGPWDSDGREYAQEALRELDEWDPFFPDLEKIPSEHARKILEQHTNLTYDEYRRIFERLSRYPNRKGT